MSEEKVETTTIVITTNDKEAITISTTIVRTTILAIFRVRDLTTLTLTINKGRPYQLRNSTTEIFIDITILTQTNKTIIIKKPIHLAVKHPVTTEVLVATNLLPSFRT